MILRVAHRVPRTAAEGPHDRFAVWVQGCSLRCPGCCNPELFGAGPGDGRPLPVDALAREILDTPGIEGVTVLGGEPLEQLEALSSLCAAVQRGGLGVLVFTGYTLARARALPGFDALWPHVDTLVDGPFDARVAEDPGRGRRFIGSRNQGLYHRSPRYADPALWRGANTAELRIEADGSLSIHGFPSHARSLRRLLALHSSSHEA